jgi:DNA-binding MarR family transcriptional regulator
VRRVQDQDDRRQVRVHLTAAGEGLLRRLAQVHREQLQRMTEDLRPPGFAR